MILSGRAADNAQDAICCRQETGRGSGRETQDVHLASHNGLDEEAQGSKLGQAPVLDLLHLQSEHQNTNSACSTQEVPGTKDAAQLKADRSLKSAGC